VIVTATGLRLLAFGGVDLAVDGEQVELNKRMTYKAMMLEGVPNYAFAIGYTNASWTLKVDLVSEYMCRLLQHMDAHGYPQGVPENPGPTVTPEPLLDFQSGYVQRSLHEFPSQGSKTPWKLRQNYAFDVAVLKRGDVADGTLRFSAAPARSAEEQIAA